jgi:hypothetical protein
VTAGEGVFDRLRLVCIELIDAALAKDVAQARIDVVAKGRVSGVERRETTHSSNPGVGRIRPVGNSAGQPLKGGCERLIVCGIGAARRKHG